jgi:acyl-coenzyme A synthetase/AMP-(fatty) acid ligase
MWDLNKYKNNIAIISETNQDISYADLEILCNKIASNISYRCLVFCLCKNTIGSLLGYLSFIQNDVVPLLLDSSIDNDLLNNLIKTYKPDYYWLPVNLANRISGGEVLYTEFDYILLKSNFKNENRLSKDLALLLTTSGSTGSVKLVRQSYLNIKSNTDSIVKYLEINESERTITTLPMNYTYGLSIINSFLHAGASIVLTDYSLMQQEFWAKFKEKKITSFGGVPYTYEMLNRLRFFKMDLPHLRTFTQAGGKLLPDLHKKFAEYAHNNGKKFIVMYGQTEATARISYLPHENSIDKCGSIGKAIPGGELFIIDAAGNKIDETNITGELVYKGLNVALGYAENSEDLNKSDEFCGVLVTGDMATIDDQGFFYIVGRKKRFIKIFGNRINLDEMEIILKKKFHQIDIACSGVDDKMNIFITDNSLVIEVKKYITNITGINHSAFEVIFIEEIPKNHSGKIMYEVLKSIVYK